MVEEMKKDVKVSEHNYRYIGKHGNAPTRMTWCPAGASSSTIWSCRGC